ncbi:MAG: ankyrin repeat domain-containing protein [Wolbachia sp.]
MPYENNVAYFGRRAGNNTAFQAQNHATSRQLSESTKQLFKAIDDENLEAFKQALAEGADVNAFDEGYTPLMAIIMNGDNSPICLKMMMLLLQHKSLNINAQETKECNTALHLAFLMENRNFVRMLLRHPNINTNIKNKVFLLQDKYLEPKYDDVRAHLIEQAQYKQWFFYTPQGYIEKIGKVQGKDFSHLTMEIMEAQRGKAFLESFSFLASSSMWVTQTLLNYNNKPNPNCWKRNQNGEIETPLSLIIKSCLQGITQDNEEVLTKLLKHKDLDFSQMKPIQAIEKNSWVKQIIEQAIKERLTDTINRKDLDDVKKLVEDNCFINRAIVTAALRDVDNPIESITNYLNEKFPANTNNIPKDFEGFVQELVDELERTKTQLAEKEKELNSAKQERLSSENRLLRSNKNEKPSQAISPGKKQSNYAYAFFILSGALTGCVGLAILYDYLVIGACLTAVALVLFLVGCHSLYKANTILSDVESTQLGGLERS